MPMKMVSIHEARTHLSRLLSRVGAGGEILVIKAIKAVTRLIPAGKSVEPRALGSQKGKFEVPEDFDAPLPADVLSTFEP